MVGTKLYYGFIDLDNEEEPMRIDELTVVGTKLDGKIYTTNDGTDWSISDLNLVYKQFENFFTGICENKEDLAHKLKMLASAAVKQYEKNIAVAKTILGD